MYGVTLAHAIAFEPPSKSRTIKVFAVIGTTAILSWPFTGALAIILIFHDFAQFGMNDYGLKQRIVALGMAAAIVILVLVMILTAVPNVVGHCAL